MAHHGVVGVGFSLLVGVLACGCSSGEEAGPAAGNPASGQGGSPAAAGAGGTSQGQGGTQGPVAGTQGAAGTPATSPEEACKAFCDATCSRGAACNPLGVKGPFGDAATCSARLQIPCLAVLALPKSGTTPASLLSCASAYQSASCQEILSGKLPAACDVPGELANGSACGDDWQCQSTQCFFDAGKECGVCKARLPVGGACSATGDCERGLRCSSAKICVAFKQAGETCDTDNLCAPGLSCYGPTGAKKCGVAPELGQKCDPAGVAAAPGCTPASGALCNATSKVCQALKTVSKGEPCDASAGPVVCVASSCQGGTCQALTADGEKCGTGLAPCQPPARCSGGRCVLVDPSKCK